jgi:hypothetical protein
VSNQPQQDPIVIFRRLREARQITIRHGRARLTVLRSGELTEGDVEPAISRFERGEIDAETLAWIFVRNRVVKHTPSFNWDDAELALLLDRIVAVTTEPSFVGSSAEEVAATLVAGARKEREALARMKADSQRWGRSMNARLGLGQGLRPILDSVQHTLGLQYGTAMKTQGVLGLSAKFGDPALRFDTPGLARASEIARTAFGSVEGSGKFDFARLGGTGKFSVLGLGKTSQRPQRLAASGFAAQLRGVHGSAYLEALHDSPPEDRLQSIVGPGLRAELGLSSISAAASFAKAFGAHAKPSFLRDAGEQLRRVSRDFLESLRQSYPANWRQLDREEINAAEDLMLNSGISLAWVPRPTILREVLEAGDEEARTAVLEARSDEIIVDIEGVLAEVTLPRLGKTVDSAYKAIAARRDGHTEAALALGAVALSDLVHDFMGEKDFRRIRKKIGEVDPHNDVDIQDFALYMVGKVWAWANRRFEQISVAGFNRNLTLHRLGEHYSGANLIAVLMLLAGLSREFERFDLRAGGLVPYIDAQVGLAVA